MWIKWLESFNVDTFSIFFIVFYVLGALCVFLIALWLWFEKLTETWYKNIFWKIEMRKMKKRKLMFGRLRWKWKKRKNFQCNIWYWYWVGKKLEFEKKQLYQKLISTFVRGATIDWAKKRRRSLKIFCKTLHYESQ